jgi:hypothetical protein
VITELDNSIWTSPGKTVLIYISMAEHRPADRIRGGGLERGGRVWKPVELTVEEQQMKTHPKFQPKRGYTWKGKKVTLFEAIQFVVEEFLSTPLPERLEKLSTQLTGKDAELAKQILSIKAKVEDFGWGVATGKDGEWQVTMTIGGRDSTEVITNEDGSVSMPGIMFNVDAFIEGNILAGIRALLNQQMVEALIGANWTPGRYQEHMRRAAGLKVELAADTKRFLERLHQRLYADERTRWMNIHAGGSKSSLDKYQGALATHYERLRPVWRQAKKIYRKHGGGRKGREAVKREYREFSPFIEGTLGAQYAKPEHRGLPDKLIAKLEPAREDAREYDSSPEYIAYEHAAFLCGFKIGEYSVKRIKEAVRAHKKMLGVEYYNHLYKGQPMSYPGRPN